MQSFCRLGADAGSVVRVSEEPLIVRSAIVRAKPANRKPVHLGDASVSTVDPGLRPAGVLGLRGDAYLDLRQVFMRVEAAGDGVEVVYKR